MFFLEKMSKVEELLFFCRVDLACCIAVVEYIFNSIIWLKIVSNNINIFLAFCYLPPENSVF